MSANPDRAAALFCRTVGVAKGQTKLAQSRLRSFICVDVGEPNLSPLFVTKMIQDYLHALLDFESLGFGFVLVGFLFAFCVFVLF